MSGKDDFSQFLRHHQQKIQRNLKVIFIIKMAYEEPHVGSKKLNLTSSYIKIDKNNWVARLNTRCGHKNWKETLYGETLVYEHLSYQILHLRGVTRKVWTPSGKFWTVLSLRFKFFLMGYKPFLLRSCYTLNRIKTQKLTIWASKKPKKSHEKYLFIFLHIYFPRLSNTFTKIKKNSLLLKEKSKLLQN